MNLLLDTHTLLWWLDDAALLSIGAREAISDAQNPTFVSAVSVWEIVIKRALGKLVVPPELEDVLAREPFRRLDVTAAHAFEVGRLPKHHGDPFDRMLVAQCRSEGLTLVTRDAVLARYDVPILRA